MDMKTHCRRTGQASSAQYTYKDVSKFIKHLRVSRCCVMTFQSCLGDMAIEECILCFQSTEAAKLVIQWKTIYITCPTYDDLATSKQHKQTRAGCKCMRGGTLRHTLLVCISTPTSVHLYPASLCLSCLPVAISRAHPTSSPRLHSH